MVRLRAWGLVPFKLGFFKWKTVKGMGSFRKIGDTGTLGRILAGYTCSKWCCPDKDKIEFILQH